MRAASALIVSLFLFVAPAALAQRAEHTWVVVSASELDARITRQIGLSFAAQKVFPPKKPGAEESLEQIVFTSKSDPLFHVSLENPSSFQRLMLIDQRKQ
jgi:hypothetical protein